MPRPWHALHEIDMWRFLRARTRLFKRASPPLCIVGAKDLDVADLQKYHQMRRFYRVVECSRDEIPGL